MSKLSNKSVSEEVRISQAIEQIYLEHPEPAVQRAALTDLMISYASVPRPDLDQAKREVTKLGSIAYWGPISLLLFVEIPLLAMAWAIITGIFGLLSMQKAKRLLNDSGLDHQQNVVETSPQNISPIATPTDTLILRETTEEHIATRLSTLNATLQKRFGDYLERESGDYHEPGTRSDFIVHLHHAASTSSELAVSIKERATGLYLFRANTDHPSVGTIRCTRRLSRHSLTLLYNAFCDEAE